MTIKLLRLAALAFCFAATVVRAAIPPAENLLPSDTIAFFTIPDCAAARVAAKVSPTWMFWDDPSMKPFRDKFIQKWNEQYIAPLERDLGINVGDFTGLPQGQLTVAATVNGSNGHDDVPPGLLLLLDAKGKSESLKTNLAALTKKWTADGRAVRTEKIHGLTFTVVPLSSNDFAGILPKKTPVQELGKEPPKPEKPGEIYFTQFESLLVAGNSPKVIEPVAAHLTGGSAPSIADNAVFAADKLSQFRDNPKYFGWFNGKMVFDMMAQAPTSDSDDTPTSPFSGLPAQKMLGALGLSALKSASFAVHEAREGTMLTVHVTAPESERAGLLKIFALNSRDASVPPFVPADAVKFSRFRLDGKQTWAEIQKMVAAISPAGQAGLDSIIKVANAMGQAKNPAFDIRNDLFGNLNDDIITYQKPVSGDSLAQISSAPTIFLIAVSNPEAAINVFKTLAGLSSPQGDDTPPREFLGRKIYSIGLRPSPVKGGAPQPRALYVSSSGGYVAISTESSVVEEFLRNADGQNKSLRDNAGLQNAMQYIGGAGGGMFGYENQRETMRVTFKALKNTITADSAMKSFPPALRSWVDFGLLPDFDVVSKYFYISTFNGSANSEGLTFKYFTPRPPQLN